MGVIPAESCRRDCAFQLQPTLWHAAGPGEASPTRPSTAPQCAEGCAACDGSPDNCFAICMDGFGLVAKPDNKGACEKCQQANCNECA